MGFHHSQMMLFSCLPRKYRYTVTPAYKVVFGFTGKNIRVVLPACAVKRIRDTLKLDSSSKFYANVILLMVFIVDHPCLNSNLEETLG